MQGADCRRLCHIKWTKIEDNYQLYHLHLLALVPLVSPDVWDGEGTPFFSTLETRGLGIGILPRDVPFMVVDDESVQKTTQIG